MKTKLLGGWMVAVAVLAPASIAVAQPGSGDLWETSMQMQMMGMSMPAVKEKVCSPKEWKEPPGLPKDNKCETLESTQLPDGYRFKVRCKGQMPMTGSGEFKNLGKDAYDGMMVMTSEMGEMTMKMSGRKVGECDAGEMQRKVAKLQKDADRAIADGARQMCEMGLESMQPTLFTSEGGCKDPAELQKYCAKFSSRAGFATLAQQVSIRGQESFLADAGKLCKVDPNGLRDRLCSEAVAKNDFGFIGGNCPKEKKVIAQRECAGRKYTALTGSKYLSFCTNYARELMAD